MSSVTRMLSINRYFQKQSECEFQILTGHKKEHKYLQI